MPNHLSVLGIFHTAISIIGVLIAIFALFRDGKINPANTTGKLYVLFTAIACLTALPIMKTGHPTAGHPVAIIILILLPLGVYTKSIPGLKKGWNYVQTVIMSITLFFSMIPAIVETLTRVPLDHPLADSPDSPIVKMSLLALLVLFVVGLSYQIVKIKARTKLIDKPDASINLN